jgi:hypothetical protein
MSILDRFNGVFFAAHDGFKSGNDFLAVVRVKVLRYLFADEFVLFVPVNAFDGRTFVPNDAVLIEYCKQIGRV